MTSAQQLIAEVRALGGILSVMGERLRIESDEPVPDELLSRLRAAKAEVIDVIRRRPWGAQDWRDHFDERAAIIEHDGASSRTEAEDAALSHCIVKWLALNPPADRGQHACCFCGLYAGADAIAVFAGEASVHRIVHVRCHTAMRAERWAEAAAAIKEAFSATEGNSPCQP
jgi:hypothetical protein